MGEIPYYSNSFFAMGTRCDVVFIHPQTEFCERLFFAVKKEIESLDEMLNRFNSHSLVSRFNQLSAGEKFYPGDRFWKILIQCHEHYLLTNGAFDIACGPVVRFWKENPGGSIEQLSIARQKSGSDKIFFDHKEGFISKNVDGLELDLGAIGKGIALDAVADILTHQGMKQAFISFGESSVLAWGNHPAGSYWPVGIPDPLDLKHIMHVFQVNNAFVTTSGTILNASTRSDTIQRHIVDPRNGKVLDTPAMVSVKSATAVLGEVISTTWLIAQEDEKDGMKKILKNIEILEVRFFQDKTNAVELITL